jgi:hypothetical protein
LDEILREIDEELRHDRARQFWQRQGKLIAAATVIFVAAYIGVVYWQNWRAQQWQVASEQYLAAASLPQAGDPASVNKAIAAFEVLAQKGDGSGYDLLSRIEAASLKLQTGQTAQGLQGLKEIAADSSVAAAYRNAALVLWGYFAVDSVPRADIDAAMAPLTAGPWHYSATEIEALACLHAGDKNAALPLFRALSDDLSAPDSMRARATLILSDLQN